jgi:hypothetical protein
MGINSLMFLKDGKRAFHHPHPSQKVLSVGRSLSQEDRFVICLLSVWMSLIHCCLAEPGRMGIGAAILHTVTRELAVRIKLLSGRFPH